MPRCFLLAVAQSSAADATTGNMSLFNLVDSVRFIQSPSGIVLPLQVHVFLAVDQAEIDRNRNILTRLVWVRSDGLEITPGTVNSTLISHPHMRLRSESLTCPMNLGSYFIRLEWCWNDEAEWHREPQQWPLDLALHEAAPASPTT